MSLRFLSVASLKEDEKAMNKKKASTMGGFRYCLCDCCADYSVSFQIAQGSITSACSLWRSASASRLSLYGPSTTRCSCCTYALTDFTRDTPRRYPTYVLLPVLTFVSATLHDMRIWESLLLALTSISRPVFQRSPISLLEVVESLWLV